MIISEVIPVMVLSCERFFFCPLAFPIVTFEARSIIDRGMNLNIVALKVCRSSEDGLFS